MKIKKDLVWNVLFVLFIVLGSLYLGFGIGQSWDKNENPHYDYVRKACIK